MKTIVIMGQARTGTSMLAGILHTMGINLNHNHNPSPQNPKGGFENHDILNITSNIVQNIEKEIQIKKFEEYSLNKIETWGFKSALTHYVIDDLIKFINNPYFIVIFRNPLDAAESWKIHMADVYGTAVTIETALERVMESYTILSKVLNKYNKIPVFMTTYEKLKSKTRFDEIEKLAKFIDINLTNEIKNNLNNFILTDYSTLKGNKNG